METILCFVYIKRDNEDYKISLNNKSPRDSMAHQTKNRHCYDFQLLTFEDGLLSDSVDATYIIHLDGNGRYEHIQDQLSMHHPTNTVYLVKNQGYKKCAKTLPISKPAHDLTDAFLQIFEHANSNKYGNILVLEDDFQFNEDIHKESVRRNINHFVLSQKENTMIYYLGCIPYLQIPISLSHSRIYLTTGTHACIYSKKVRECTLLAGPENIVDWDLHHNINSCRYARYMYYRPICYQLVPETENQREWYNPGGIADLLKLWMRILGIDKEVEPGYSICYLLSFLFFFIILMFFIYMVYVFIGPRFSRFSRFSRSRR